MPDNVCQRCQTPLQPSEAGVCMPCFPPFLWEEFWPAMEEVMHRWLPPGWEPVIVEAVTQQFIAAWSKAPLSGLAPTIPLHTHVQAAAAWWRTVPARLEALRSLAGGLPPPVQLAGLTCIALAVRNLARQYVSQYYNLDMDQRRFVRRGVGEQRTLDEEIARSLGEMNTLTAACQDATLCETMLLAALEALWGAPQLAGKGASECMQAAVDAMLGVLEALPLFTGTLMESPLEHQQEQGAVSVAGWAATQLSLDKNRRLRHAVEQDASASEQSLYAAFLAQLPGAVHLAYSTDPDALLDTLLTNIKHVLEPGASSSRAKGAQDPFPAVQSSVEDMWLREEARKARNIESPRVRTRLTPRELEFCDLMYELARQGKSCTYAEIAAQKGVAEGTVKSTMDHIRGKLRHIASA